MAKGPSYKEIFTAENPVGTIRCGVLEKQNEYCDQKILTFNPQTNAVGDKVLLNPIYLSPSKGPGDILVEKEIKIDSQSSYGQVLGADNKSKYWIKFKKSDLTSLPESAEKLYDEYFNLNPHLKNVFKNKNGKNPIKLAEALVISSEQSKNLSGQIGTITLTVTMTHLDKTNPLAYFSFKSRGQAPLMLNDLLEMSDEFKNQKNPEINLKELVQRNDQVIVSLPVYAKKSDAYLVQIPEHVVDKFEKGVVFDLSASDGSQKTFTWISKSSVPLQFKEQTVKFEPEILIQKTDSFSRNGQQWYGFKAYAMSLDFEKIDKSGNLLRKKTLIGSFFIPVFDEKKRINFWPNWDSGD